MSQLLLEAAGIYKSYAGVQALKNVRFSLEPSEVHALIGENGAGKSTLIKIITGAVLADAGRLSIDQAGIDTPTPALMKSLGVAAIYQQPSLFGHLTVAENIALALEPLKPFSKVDWSKRHALAKQLLKHIGSAIDPQQEAASLSMPQQQMVEIAKAIGCEAKIFVMDEPTASLSDKEVDNLFRVIAELRSKGAGIIYISHRLEELSRISDRISVLRDGQLIATKRMKEVSRDELVQLMVGREVSAIYPKKQTATGKPVLSLRALKAQGIGPIDLELRAGEILGLAGLVGSGRTELANVIFGLTPSLSGTIERNGQPLSIQSPQSAIKAGIALVPEDRRHHGLVQEMSVAENTTLAGFPPGFLNFTNEANIAREFAHKLGTKTPSVDTPAENLSGGNQQKVVLSRWLATKPSVLILDEPTQGIDVGAKSEVHALITEMAREGMAILMISSELPEILGMSDRIAVMRQGKLAGILNRSEATQEAILHLALPQIQGAA